jgi:hypothetical protein
LAVFDIVDFKDYLLICFMYRRMTKMDEFSFIPYSQQAVLPQYLKEPAITADQISQNTSDKIDRYNMPEERITGPELLVMFNKQTMGGVHC